MSPALVAVLTVVIGAAIIWPVIKTTVLIVLAVVSMYTLVFM